MYPNFEDKEYVLTKLIGYSEFLGIKFKFASPKRGDVIVFKAPREQEKEFIKRVIGLPGDTVSIRDGYIYVNEQKLNESAYLDENVRTRSGSFAKDSEILVVPQQAFFVMGDNRQFSSDSREWGFVPKDLITGESFVVYWPPDHVRQIKNPFN